MHIIPVLLIFFVSIFYLTNAEIYLVIGVPKKVVFDGDHLIIRVTNPEKLNATVNICLGGTKDSRTTHCAVEMAEFTMTLMGQLSADATVNRKGETTGMSSIQGEVKYKWDGALDVSLQYKSHDSIIVNLANARDWSGGPEKRNWTPVIIAVCCVTFGVLSLSCIVFLLICRYAIINKRKATPGTTKTPKG